jgi:hypothetical protein
MPLSPNLSPDDARQFFDIMLPLQHFANQQLGLYPAAVSLGDYLDLPREDKAAVRSALYEHPEVLARFVADNPAGLPPEALDIAGSWQQRRAGPFVILSFLKRYTVVLEADTNRVYGVLGLTDELRDVLYPVSPPVVVDMVLLPFKGRLVYDGFLEPRSLLLGPHLTAELRATYRRAKTRGEIIETLEPQPEPGQPRPLPAGGAWRPLLADVADKAEKLKLPGSPVHQQAFGLVRASTRLAKAVTAAAETKELVRLARRVQKALDDLMDTVG